MFYAYHLLLLASLLLTDLILIDSKIELYVLYKNHYNNVFLC